MSTYIDMGSRGPVFGAEDETGRNPGNWTVVFSPDQLNFYVPYVEICHIVVAGAAGSTFDVYVDLAKWDTNQNGYKNSWDPAVPLPVRPGQYLYFFWSDSVTDLNPPEVTIWLRYDQDIRANLENVYGRQGY